MVANLRPGTQVTAQQAPQPRGATVQTGTWFVVGTAEKGPTTSAQLVRNLTEFQLYFGSRKSYSILWDCAETFFREGGKRMYIVRVAGASAAAASATFNDSSAAPSIKVSAKNVGVWGNSLSPSIVAATGGYQIVVTHTTLGVVETSPVLTSQADAISWSRKSIWVTVTLPVSAGTNAPAVAGATAMTGGADDNTSGVTDSIRQAALPYFTADLGTGQVSIPGSTTSGVRTALLAHAVAYGREAVLDNTDSGTTATLLTEALGLQGNEFDSLFGPWHLIPGLAASPTNLRTVPPCAATAALMARTDALANSNQAAAGAEYGVLNYVVGLTQPGFSDVDRDALNTAGLNLYRTINGVTQLFGYRSLAPTGSVWLWLGTQRFRNEFTARAQIIANSYLFKTLNRLNIAAFGGALRGLCNEYFQADVLFGDSAGEAYSVDIGDSINTDETIAAGELHAAVGLRVAPGAEFVTIAITAVPVSQSL